MGLPNRFDISRMRSYRVGRSDAFSVGVLHKHASSSDVLNVVSPYFNAIYVIQGTGEYRDATVGRVPLTAGDCFFRFVGTKHSSLHTPDGLWVEAFLVFPKPFSAFLESAGLVSRAMPVIRPGFDLAIADRFLELLQRLENPDAATVMRTMADGHVLLTELCLRARRGQESEQDHARLSQAVRLLEEQPEKRLSLPRMARELGMGYEAFRKWFRAAMGVSPGEYRIRRRIDRAQRLLMDHERQIKDIAAELGYPGPAAFSAQFSRFSGYSPNLFRRLHGVRVG